MFQGIEDAPSRATRSAAPARREELRRVELPTGTLEVRVEDGIAPLDRLCGFAARRNPRRGFLFVSRVLGRHLPVAPSRMRWAHERLAERTEADLPGPVLFLGLAETAAGLGQGVHEAYLRRTGRADTVFLHSTRYRLEREPFLRFEEEHSHASSHTVYLPRAREARALLRRARSVVLVDDEASTGRTFLNLAAALADALPELRRCRLLVLTDWCGAAGRRALLAEIPVPARMASLLSGTYRFTPSPALPAVEMPRAAGNGAPKDALLARDHGRLGGAVSAGRVGAMARALLGRAGERVLVLGTGEFAHAPFRLAMELERLGARVRFQATTRSPALVGHALESALRFADNYGDGIDNFLYNVRRGDHDRVLVCHETPAGTLDPALRAGLAAETVAF